jgi:glycosyltransferase involved in cell wall biosynthesis
MFASIVSLLREARHEVTLFERHNRDIKGVFGYVKAAVGGIYSHSAKRDMRRVIEEIKPDLIHLHNIYPLISPSVLDACRATRTPVVMRLADFTLLCPTSHHFRRGAVCELCLGGREYQCVLTNCRGNILMSSAYAARTAISRLRRCFLEKVTLFIAPTEFVRKRFVDMGFAAERIIVIPNMVEIPGRAAVASQGEYIAYVGRISSEKGIDVLLRAAGKIDLPVRIAGEVPPESNFKERALANVEFVGKLSRPQIYEFLSAARFAVAPSVCLESFSLASAEAMACGLPVIASRIGGIPEVVEHLKTGILFEAGDAAALAKNMTELWYNPRLISRLGTEARDKAVAEYSPSAYYARLISAYEKAITLAAKHIQS